jgi:predicted transposase YbfD/YdcC
MENIYELIEQIKEVETTGEHNGYSFSVVEALTIVILGSFCGLTNTNKIHQWSRDPQVGKFLRAKFGIIEVPCYYWLLCLLKLVVPESLNSCFINWVNTMLPSKKDELTVSIDGKTIKSTCRMKKYSNPLHIVSAQLTQLGMTFGQKAVNEKSNEIPAVRELISMLNLEGCLVVADALNCQKETAKAITQAKADYLLNVKDNQEALKQDIENYFQRECSMDDISTAQTTETNRGRIEDRQAFVTSDIGWLPGRENWANLASIGAISRRVVIENKVTDEWSYYISSRNLTAESLLKNARLEWEVESMHWLLDVNFDEDSCRIQDKNIELNLNMVRKIVLNSVKRFKISTKNKKPISTLLFDCLLNPDNIFIFFDAFEN